MSNLPRATQNPLNNPLTNPLAYCPPNYLGAKTEKVGADIVKALRGILLDPKIWQLSTETTQNGSLVTLVYKGLVEHLYKEYQVVPVTPDGIPRPDRSLTKIYQVFLSLSSRSEGGVGTAPKYVLNLWVVDQEGSTVEDYEVGLGEVLRELFPTAQTFKLRWERSLEGPFLVRVDGWLLFRKGNLNGLGSKRCCRRIT